MLSDCAPQLIIGNQPFQRAAASYVRFKVFVLERDIPMAEEFDQLDTPERTYAVIYLDKEPVATARFVQENSKIARLTRIATLSEYRGKGFARQIIESLEKYAQKRGVTKLQIHAELTAKTFYEELGYVAYSDIYTEDGQLCQSLQKTLPTNKGVTL